MLRDVFYFGRKPNVHPREKFATDLVDARQQASTEHFWVINEFCDYRGFDWDFDFEFLPDEDVWAEEHNNVWPSQHQKDSGTWLCPKEHSDLIVYRNDVDPIKRKNVKTDNWILLDKVDETKFDFSWHPDPSDPPYIYKWGCKFFPAQLQHVLEYHVDGATQVKYMRETVELVPNDCWVEYQTVDKDHFDMSWRPDPMDPPYIYVWGNKHIEGTLKSTLEYHVPGATEKKYMPELLNVLPEWDKWVETQQVDRTKFDFTWRPDPREPAYIYTWGNKWVDAELKPTVEYRCEGATERKYMSNDAPVLSEKNRWKILENVKHFDFTWRPDPREPAFIYVFGNDLYDAIKMPTVEYHCEGATERKYMDNLKATLESAEKLYEHLEDSTLADYSWLPDPDSPPYIYAWGNQWNKPEDKVSVQLVVPGATEYKFMEARATRKPCMDNWIIPDNVDVSDFDFSWEPSPADPPYIYQFGTQWQKTGGHRYVVPGATEIKYVDFQKAKALPNKQNWEMPDKIRIASFDYSWHPDSTEQPYVYQFGTQWQLTGGPKYVVPDAVGTKYIDPSLLHAIAAVDMSCWEVPTDIDRKSFDFSWHPHPDDPDFVYKFGTQWQKTGGPTYVPNVADSEMLPVKYIDTRILKAKKLPFNKDAFTALNGYKIRDFDYSWHPDDSEQPFIYVFGNTQYPAEIMPTIEYRVKGATQVKHVNNIVATLDVDMTNWDVPSDVDATGFDFNWKPNPKDPAYIYQFGTQWQKTGGPRYTVPGATEVKYIDTKKVKMLPVNRSMFTVLNDYKIRQFDYSWHPDASEEPFIYVFGNSQYPAEIMPTIEYRVPGATQVKYVADVVATLDVDMNNWDIPSNVNASNFDFSWKPNPKDPAYIYQFGTQHQKTGGPRYVVDGATEVKYIDTRKAKILPSLDNWEIPKNINVTRFDFSWHPDATEPNYIYQFGTIMDDNDGPRYVPKDNNGKVVYKLRVEVEEEVVVEVPKYYITTTLEALAKEHPNETFWALNDKIDYTNFDFNWRPQIVEVAWESSYVHVFGSADSEMTHTYFINAKSYLSGNKDFKFVESKSIDTSTLASLFKKPSMFLVDRGNPETQKRFEQLKARFPDIQKTRYLNTWVDTISRCINRSSTDLCWILNSELDYSDFNFEYYPNPWQMKMVHVFGTQWSHWGTTFMVNRESFANDTKYIKVIEHLSNLNFVKDQDKRAKATSCLYDVYVIDHGNKEMFKTFRTIQSKVGDKSVTNIEYEFSYLHTFRNILKDLPEKKEHYIWICSSVCDYKNFDFTYICDPFAREQLHVFPSDKQKFGDTFLVNINKLRELVDNMNVLQDYDRVNFNQHQRPTRFPAPEVISDSDTHTDSLDVRFDYPYVVLVSEDNKDIEKIDYEPMNLWAPETKNIIVTSTGGTRIVVPKEAKDVVKRELYDYPNIIKTTKLAKSKPLDIVFLSNGEPCADENYEHLLNVTKGLSNRIVRVDGVNGRVAAYHAAAEASESPWMFTVFAKLKVSNKFDWNWQPDRLQVPKHYVFHAKNPVNGLVYGHQAMIAYNKKMTLANQGKGLDFTQDDDHEVLNILSGTANFNVDEWTTWRTAFREAIKLCTFADEVSQERLTAWTTIGNGAFGQYSIDGANDAVAYFDEVAGDFTELKLSYDWAWLRDRFDKRYK